MCCVVHPLRLSNNQQFSLARARLSHWLAYDTLSYWVEFPRTSAVRSGTRYIAASRTFTLCRVMKIEKIYHYVNNSIFPADTNWMRTVVVWGVTPSICGGFFLLSHSFLSVLNISGGKHIFSYAKNIRKENTFISIYTSFFVRSWNANTTIHLLSELRMMRHTSNGAENEWSQ